MSVASCVLQLTLGLELHRTANFSHLVSPLEAIQRRAIKDKTALQWTLDDWNVLNAGDLAQYKDVAIVFISADSGEGT